MARTLNVPTVLAVLVGLPLVAYLAGRDVQRGRDAEAAAADRANLALGMARSWRTHLDSTAAASTALRIQLAQLQGAIARGHARDDSLRDVGDSLARALANARSPGDSLRACVAGWTSCRARVAAVQTIADATGRQLTLVTADRDRWRAADSGAVGVQDSLGAALRRVQQSHSCRILFWRCPSRTVAFGVGALASALAFTLTH